MRKVQHASKRTKVVKKATSDGRRDNEHKKSNSTRGPSTHQKRQELVALVEHYLDEGASDRAIPHLRDLARRGDAWAQYMLGLAYQYGDGIVRSRARAERWYRMAAEQRYDSAILNLGLLHASARPPRYEDAFSCFVAAAAKGNRNAAYNIGLYYECGRGVLQNARKSVEWYIKAARLGDADAQWHVGYAYETGEGVAKNLRRSFQWYLKAAHQGDSDAQCRIGYCYHEGEGTRRSYAEALNWYRKAAAQDHGSACYNIGLCHLHGEGVQVDKAAARKWLRRASELGNRVARERLRELS